MNLLTIHKTLSEDVARLSFAEPVHYVYNPLDYAWAPLAEYLIRYGKGKKAVLFVGMNPGPFGMAQTGIPFGDCTMVREWLQIAKPVGHPQREHPKRPILGLDCPRREVSGTRLWGWAKERWGTPERFFTPCFVYNFCPLIFLEESGRNRTPDKLPVLEKQPLLEVCNQALRRIVETLAPAYVMGVGGFAENQATEALAGLDHLTIGRIPHPSPANPAANRGWAQATEAALRDQGLDRLLGLSA
ncbi:MAG: single-stranded DNA-binding protein [bacterium]|jgi:single-strand selective monofunctional uracil DNA glycosylase|nr:single-stranded DNA-binding protein [bacterium]